MAAAVPGLGEHGQRRDDGAGAHPARGAVRHDGVGQLVDGLLAFSGGVTCIQAERYFRFGLRGSGRQQVGGCLPSSDGSRMLSCRI